MSNNYSFLIDIDECASYPCDPFEMCVDLVGNFSCECFDGFTGLPCEYGKQC